LGIGDWAQSPIPNPQSPIPNPHIDFFFLILFEYKNNFYLFIHKKNEIKKIEAKRNQK
jgi:hypothetical protein